MTDEHGAPLDEQILAIGKLAGQRRSTLQREWIG
jgi:hypothetical protein